MKLRRTIFKLTLLLIIGAIINIAVAWGFCAFGEMGLLSEYYSTSDEELSWLAGAGLQYGMDREAQFIQNSTYLQMTATGMQIKWVKLTYVPDTFINMGPLPSNFLGLRLQVGWPIYSLSGVKLNLKDTPSFLLTQNGLPHDQDYKNVGIIDLPGKFTGRMLPWHPIYLGFIVNTLFYALIVWLMIYVPRSMFRERRWRRGLCPDCGYPIGSSPTCTECGFTLKPANHASHS
ncbi:MAG TPA: hypothetical protein VG711_03045 [Phycisphaerales bacterium]|nr:hypothetical protein [Phycisphaerales bacterium]